MGNLTCPEHGIDWFKRGKMKNYAHPIGDTGKWCNMPEEEIFTDDKPEPKMQRDFSKPTPIKETVSKDPDWDAIRGEKQSSIEGQNASGITGQLWAAGKLKDDSDEVKLLRLILIDRLGKYSGVDMSTTRIKEAIKTEVDKIKYPVNLIDDIKQAAKEHGFWDADNKIFNMVKFEKFLELNLGKPIKATELRKEPLEKLDKIHKLLLNIKVP
jgi:hypothetical protein